MPRPLPLPVDRDRPRPLPPPRADRNITNLRANFEKKEKNPAAPHCIFQTLVCTVGSPLPARPCCQEVEGTKSCSICLSVKYCSKSCQKKHWKTDHKKECEQMKESLLNDLPSLEEVKRMSKKCDSVARTDPRRLGSLADELIEYCEMGRRYFERSPGGKAATRHCKAGCFCWSSTLSQAHTDMGHAYKAVGKKKLAFEQYKKSMEIDRDLSEFDRKYKIDEAAGLSNMANMLGDFDVDEEEHALALKKEALSIYTKMGDEDGKCRSLCDIGSSYRGQGNWELGESYYLKSMRLAKKIGNKQVEAISCENVGSHLQREHRHEEALELFIRILRLYEEDSDFLNVAGVRNSIGESLCYLDKLEDAIEQYTKALDFAKPRHMRPEMFESYSGLAEVYEKQGEIEKAIEALEGDRSEQGWEVNGGGALRALKRMDNACVSHHQEHVLNWLEKLRRFQ